jgi:hypothetical protein
VDQVFFNTEFTEFNREFAGVGLETGTAGREKGKSGRVAAALDFRGITRDKYY